MEIHPKRHTTIILPLTVIALLILALMLAGGALAESGGMSEMPGMTEEEMQNMATPQATAAPADAHAATPEDGHGSEAGMDPNMDMDGGSANWFVVGGFVALIAGVTLAAVATKRHLRRRILAGELAGAGAQGV